MKWDIFKVYLPIALLVAAAFYITFQFVEPPPPDRIRMAAGAPGGAYSAFAQEYADALVKEGVGLEIIPTSGSVENLELLMKDEADVGFVQGGVGDPPLMPSLMGLASLYYEPLWVFKLAGGRPDAPLDYLDLSSTSVAIGGLGSGTQALAREMMEINGQLANVEVVELGGGEAAEALRSGEVDFALFVAGVSSPLILDLLRDPAIELVSVPRAEGYSRQLRHLSALLLPEGSVHLAENLPSQDITLLAPAATLVVRDELHPALVNLLMQAAVTVHEEGDALSQPGEFPSPRHVEFPLSEEARRFHDKGPPFLQRYLPYWIANLIDRLWILMIPLLTVLFPLFRVAPPIYRWRVRRKIYRWYQDLREIEEKAQSAERAAPNSTSYNDLRQQLEALQAEVGQIDVPLAYSEHLYHLRLHISFVMNQLDRPGESPPPPEV